MSGQQRLVMTRGGYTYPAVVVDSALAASLEAAGANPWALNSVEWPMGMARHAHGEILITETTLRAIVDDNAGAVPSSVSVVIGTSGSEITLEGMIPLNPRPITVAGTGSGASGGTGRSRLFALPVVDARYFLNGYSSNSYNVPGPAGAGIFVSTTQDGASALWTYDQIVAQLASDLGVTVTITDAFGTTSYPYGYSIQGMSAAQAMDQILAETGRVLVASVSGAYSVEWVNKRTAADVLAPVADSIAAGSVSWSVGSPAGWLAQSIPVAAWRRNIVPPSVKVNNPFFLGVPATDTTIENGRQVYRTTATYTAASASLDSNASNGPLVLNDSMPAYGTGLTPSNTVALLAKANDLATSYYRRFLAGEMLGVVLNKVALPTFGGSCLCALWSVDAVRGGRTVLNSMCDDPLLGFMRTNPAVLSGGEGFVYGFAHGDGRCVAHPQQRLVLGTISSTTGDDPDLPADIAYAGEVDGEFSGNTFSGLSPAYRPTGASVKLHPAAAGSKCLLNITNTSSGGAVTVEMLVAFGETPLEVSCP